MEKQPITVEDANGDSGTLDAPPQAARSATVPVHLPSGVQVQVERDLLEARGKGSYYLKELTFRNLESAAQSPGEGEIVIPVAEERVRVRKQKRETGRVRIEKRVEEQTEAVDVPLVQERVDVERVSIDRVVDEPTQTRREGQTIIVPVLEERLVVRKELVLKEELHITVRQAEHLASQEVALRRETVNVRRTRPEDPPNTAETEVDASGE